MANYREDIVNIDLECGTLHRSFLHHSIGEGDALANRFGVRVFRGKEPVQLMGTCTGYFIRADGTTVPLTNGVISGNVAYVTLTETCYAVEGVFALAIKITSGGEKVTFRIVDGVVSRTSTDTAVDPGEVIQNIESLIDAIENAVESIPPDYSSLTGIAKTNGLLFADANKMEYVHFTDGAYIYYQTGELRKNVDYSYTDYMVVIPGAYCELENASNPHTTFWDEKYTFISGTLATEFTIPDNAVYMIVSIPIVDQGVTTAKWTDNRITTHQEPVTDETGLSDFDNAEWNKTYVLNIFNAASWAEIENAPVKENGTLITIDTDYRHYAARQMYITVTGYLYVRFYVPAIDGFTEWTNNNKEAEKVGVLYNKFMTSGIASEFAGSFTPTANGFEITTNAIMGRFYSIENRTAVYLCKVFSDSVVAFYTAPYTDVSAADASMVVNVGSKTVKLNGFTTKNCDFLTGGHVICVEMGKHYQKLTIRITDMMTGDVFEDEYINNGTGGAGEGAIGTANNVPMQYDYYGVKKISGTSVIWIKFTVKCATADVVVYGDSITEQEAYWPTDLFDKTWTQMLINESSLTVITSGRSGTTINKVLERIKNELPYLKPKFCVITIGTNGGNTEEALTELVEYIKSMRVVPILNHIPCFNNNGDDTGFISINNTIDSVRAATGVKGCNFDLCTSLNYDGTQVNTDMMWLETYSGGAVYYHHPNVKGSAAMLAQLKSDVPEIF